MSTLFEDIIIEHVLTRLPLRTLKICKCVCKAWEYVLSNPDPQFISSHITHTSKNPENEYLIISALKNQGRHTIDILSGSRFSYSTIDIAPPNGDIVGSINGLVCLIYKHLFLLWNPVTALCKTIVQPQLYLEKSLCKTIVQPQHYWENNIFKMFYGFSWDYVESEFKIVIYYTVDKSIQGFVYTSNSDSWNELATPDIFSCTNFLQNPKITVDGCPYWLTYRENQNFVIKFESGSNRFKDFALPPQIVGRYHYILVDLKDCLTMIAYSAFGQSLLDVLHLDEECGVWSKTYTFGPIYYCGCKFLSQCFKYSGRIVFNNAKMLYDPKTNGIKVIGDGQWNFIRGFSYTPSLVFLHGMEPLHTQSHWRSSNVGRSVLTPTPSHARSLFSRLLLGCFGWN